MGSPSLGFFFPQFGLFTHQCFPVGFLSYFSDICFTFIFLLHASPSLPLIWANHSIPLCLPVYSNVEDRRSIISIAKRCSYNSPAQRSNPSQPNPHIAPEQERPMTRYIFEKEIVQGPQKQCSQVKTRT